MTKTFFVRMSILIFIALFSFSTGCFQVEEKKDEVNNHQAEANAIVPSASTMTIDFSTFSAINARSREGIQGRAVNFTAEEANCWFSGTLYAAWAIAICYTPLAIPLGVYAVLTTQIPTEFSAGHVKWSYTWKETGGTSHSAVVTADKNTSGDAWVWSLAVDGFTWLNGESRVDKTSGWWQFHDARMASGADTTILVDWTYTDSVNKTVKFTLNNTSTLPTGYGHGEAGDYILFTQAGSNFSVRIYDLRSDGSGTNYNTGSALDFTINWSSTTKGGNITVESGSLPIWASAPLAAPGVCTFDPN